MTVERSGFPGCERFIRLDNTGGTPVPLPQCQLLRTGETPVPVPQFHNFQTELLAISLQRSAFRFQNRR